MSLESATHTDEEVIFERRLNDSFAQCCPQELPDLDAAARDFYKEVRALSMDTGGSMADILENIGASSESLSSLIPHEKREVIMSRQYLGLHSIPGIGGF